MISADLVPIRELLERIEKKLMGILKINS